MIPISCPSIGKEELEAVERVFSSKWLGLGSVVYEFEQKLKEYLNAKNVIAVNTGTAALHIALDALSISSGDEVLVPSLTFAGTIQAILAVGATPVFCEVNRDTLNMAADDVKKRITNKSRAIMPVHYCGLACDMDDLLKIAKENGLRVVEDAAHAFGSSYKGRKIGSFGDVTCFSFDPIKNITCGEGGAVALKDTATAERITRKRLLGIDKDTWHRYQNKRSWFYEVVDSGFRYHMSNINAAIGLEQLKKIDKFIAKKREITARYDEEFRKLRYAEILKNDYENTAQFCYILKVKKNRDEFMDFMESKGVGCGINYIPNHTQPHFKKFYSPLPVTEELARQIVTLPLYYAMGDGDVECVISNVRQFVTEIA